MLVILKYILSKYINVASHGTMLCIANKRYYCNVDMCCNMDHVHVAYWRIFYLGLCQLEILPADNILYT
jgi:hypothetical protein